VQIPATAIVRYPERWGHAPQVERSRVAAQRLASAPVEVLVEVRHGQLAQAAIDRVTVTKLRTVVLGNGSPAATTTEQRDDVRVIAGVAIEV